ncbi:serine/threonine-protein phosphatase 6 regulatory ankyrin repeat subunit C-like [Nasonia vitripennis]|uniref:Uncharacterized protein n=1 Tax=Nasonia vitripennis TaxID=7425 RepID=A0A7M7H5Z5_NASVI|nr:serine/threonine-protein phosphatase 6 regulatory ankyrin repeat subunit C-like [Nasonia vitripennis]XP_008210036.1 serine/threonine-protein phosphatase 6 regulatory ankyrin repeat subunit C-like [Nasonia vitripennis]
MADGYGNTTLHYAISYQNFEMVKQLLSLGVDVCAGNKDHVTPLQLAIANKIPIDCLGPRIYVLRQHDRFRNCLDSYDCAIKARDDKVLDYMQDFRISDDDNRKLVKMLLNAGADVNSKDRYECSPIHCAVFTGDLELVKILIEAGADLDSQNDVGATALHAAVLCRDEPMVELLLNSGANVSFPLNCQNETVLYWASMLNWGNSFEVIIRKLLEAGGDVSQSFEFKDPDNSEDLEPDSNISGFERTPFDFILMYGDINLINLCMEKYNAYLDGPGGNMDVSDALKFAAYNEDPRVMNLVLDSGITNCNFGFSALHHASAWFRPQLVRMLIRDGAEVDIMVEDEVEVYKQYTPLAYCIEAKDEQQWESEIERPNAAEDRRKTIKLLLDCGANLNQKINEKTALEIAITSNDQLIEDAERLIIEHAVLVEARTNKKVLDEYNLKLIDENPRLKMYYEKCQSELTAMKKSMIKGTFITYFSVLTKPLQAVAPYVKNKESVKNFKANYRVAYPAYAWRLKEKFEAAVARQQKIQLALPILSSMKEFADRDSFDNILSYLSEEDLDMLINCGKTSD